MKKLAATFAIAAAIGSACSAMAAESDYVVVLKKPTQITDDNIICLSDRVYLAPSYMEALSAVDTENLQSIFMDEELDIPSSDFEIGDERAALSETPEILPHPDGANDTNYSRQWYLPYIKAQSAWKKGLTGEGIKVGIIDTGINPLHVDLLSKTTDSFSCLSSDTANVTDTYGHGTMVAGIMAATTNNSKCTSGITSDVELAVIKIIENDNSKPNVSHLLAGITKAIDFDCDVINMSLGWTTNDETSDSFLAIKQEITKGVEKGIIFVSSSGNISEDTTEVPKYYPAAFDNVISVASLGRYETAEDKGKDLPTAEYNGTTIITDEPSVFSVHNNEVTCAAPGFRIASTFISSKKADGTYTDPLVSIATSDGTSYAAPMVSSAAVIAKQLDPTINHARFEEYLRQSVRDVYTEGYDEHTGYGALDIESLIRVIEEDTYVPPTPVTGLDAAVNEKDSTYTVMTFFDAAPSDFRIIAAAYNDDRLVLVKSQDINAGSEGTNFRFTYEEEVDTVLITAWTKDGIYPLADCVKLDFEPATPESSPEPDVSENPDDTTEIPENTPEPTTGTPTEEMNE